MRSYRKRMWAAKQAVLDEIAADIRKEIDGDMLAAGFIFTETHHDTEWETLEVVYKGALGRVLILCGYKENTVGAMYFTSDSNDDEEDDMEPNTWKRFKKALPRWLSDLGGE